SEPSANFGKAEPYEGRGFADHPDPPLKAARTFALADARWCLCAWRSVDGLGRLCLLEDLAALFRRDQLDRPQVAQRPGTAHGDGDSAGRDIVGRVDDREVVVITEAPEERLEFCPHRLGGFADCRHAVPRIVDHLRPSLR